MSDIALMLQAVDFIERHLQEDITVADVAESVNFSLFHFSRTFSRMIRHSPYDYLMRRRLCEAARCLLQSDEKIIEIAFDYQFNAPETFSRAFKRMFHLQPRQARLQQGFDQRLMMGKPTLEYVQFLNSGVSLKPTRLKMPAAAITGIATQIGSRDAVDDVPDMWALFEQEMRSTVLATGSRTYMGVTMVPSVPSNPVMYLAGTVLEEGEEAPVSFVRKNIPAVDVASFDIPQQPGSVPFTRQYAHHTWWPKATAAPLPQLEIEQFFDRQDACLPRSILLPLDLFNTPKLNKS